MVNGPEDLPPETDLDAVDWDWVDWSGCEREVRRLRQRIFKATREGDWPRVRSLQKLMLRSRSNTLMSVRQVTQRNAGRKTAGIDGEVAFDLPGPGGGGGACAREHRDLAASRGQARVHTEGIKPCEAEAARNSRDHGPVSPGTGA